MPPNYDATLPKQGPFAVGPETFPSPSGKYDIGIAFDGDADRIGVVDNTGEIIWADQLMTIFLPELIEEGDKILFDVKCSQALEDMIIKHGGKPVMWKTGH